MDNEISEELENTTIIDDSNSTVTVSKIDEIAYNTGVISDGVLFLVAFIVVCVVCFLLWKSLDNFISY